MREIRKSGLTSGGGRRSRSRTVRGIGDPGAGRERGHLLPPVTASALDSTQLAAPGGLRHAVSHTTRGASVVPILVAPRGTQARRGFLADERNDLLSGQS